MVTLDQLAALDLVIWLRTSERAAEMLCTNQSTISRRSRATLQEFGVRVERNSDGWHAIGDTETLQLLQLQRQLHQRARLIGRQPLRLQVPFWTRNTPQWRLPEGWCTNPPDPALACEDPVGLLRDRVIDACLITSCQMPADADDLVLLELYCRPIELTLFPPSDCADVVDVFRRQRDHGGLNLERVKFLPNSCTRNAASLFQVLTGAAPPKRPLRQPLENGHCAVSVSFLTPEMRSVQEQPWVVGDFLDPCLYVERLAVLAENAAEPAVQRLQNLLVDQFVNLST